MKFKEADEKLAALRPNTYRTVTFTKRTYGDGTVETECCLYYDGSKIFASPTFQGAFDLMNPPTEEMQDEIGGGEVKP